MDEKRRKQMNKALVILLVPLVAATAIAIFVIVRFPGLHDNANDIRERLWQVESVDEQLEQLELLAKSTGTPCPGRSGIPCTGRARASSSARRRSCPRTWCRTWKARSRQTPCPKR